MKIQLPLENWADLLPFVPRRQLVALLFKLGDPQFVSILQYCLNEVGHITLGHLRIRAPKENNAIDGPIVELLQMTGWTPVLETSIPDEPIPKNVHNFKTLTFRYYDSSVLNFLQKFHQHQNALLANVNLSIHRHDHDDLPISIMKLQPILAQILPLIGDNIKSLQLIEDTFLGYSRLLNNGNNGINRRNNDEFSELVTKILTQTRILSIRSSHLLMFDWCCRWLYAPRMDGRPRMLNLLFCDRAFHFINYIKEDFLMAKHPVTFFIRVGAYLSGFENVCLENGETNENLMVVKHSCEEFLISRFPREANGAKWIQANEQEILEFKRNHKPDRTICLDLDI